MTDIYDLTGHSLVSHDVLPFDFWNVVIGDEESNMLTADTIPRQ